MNRTYKLLCIYLASTHRVSQAFTHSNKTQLTRLPAGLNKRNFSVSSSASSAEELVEVMTDGKEKSWRSLLDISIARTRKIRGSNYVQLATVENGEPRCRTIVFRGFQKVPDDHSLSNECSSLPCLLKMCTDLRSKKVEQNSAQSIAEVVWWFPKTSEQYRIRGDLILVGSEEENDKALITARKELWGNLSDPARESFLGNLLPGELLAGEETADIPPGGRGEDGKPVPPPGNFLLMLLDPKHVDYLLLGKEQHRQIDIRGGDGWSFDRVNP